MGLIVKRCDYSEEAAARTRELQATGRLRAVIVAGGEGIEGCNVDCEDNHDMDPKCIVCGSSWNEHNGHNCPGDGARGSFPSDQDDDNDGTNPDVQEYVSFIRDLFSSFGQDPLPPNRVCFYGGHVSLQEDTQMLCWKLGVFVAEDDAVLQNFVADIEDWPQEVTGNEIDATLLDELKSEMKQVESTSDKQGDSKPTKPTRPVVLTKQSSTGTLRLDSLKHHMELLDNKRQFELEEMESERKVIKAQVTAHYETLRGLVDARALSLKQQLEKYAHVLVTEEQIDQAKTGSPASAKHAALALTWFKSGAWKDDSLDLSSVLKLKAHAVQLVLQEINFLEHTTLAAKVMAYVPLQQKKLLNLTYDWIRTFLPHCLAKINRVSFGLLTEEDCRKVLEKDPFVPRSRTQAGNSLRRQGCPFNK